MPSATTASPPGESPSRSCTAGMRAAQVAVTAPRTKKETHTARRAARTSSTPVPWPPAAIPIHADVAAPFYRSHMLDLGRVATLRAVLAHGSFSAAAIQLHL